MKTDLPCMMHRHPAYIRTLELENHSGHFVLCVRRGGMDVSSITTCNILSSSVDYTDHHAPDTRQVVNMSSGDNKIDASNLS